MHILLEKAPHDLTKTPYHRVARSTWPNDGNRADTAETITGPSSSATPYVINVPKNVDITSILTVGDSIHDKADGVTPYRMVGIPEGSARQLRGRSYSSGVLRPAL
jgi:hypothetical protein